MRQCHFKLFVFQIFPVLGNENLVEDISRSAEQTPSAETQKSMLSMCWTWFCGFQYEDIVTPEHQAEIEHRLSSIEQTRNEKIILNINYTLFCCFLVHVLYVPVG